MLDMNKYPELALPMLYGVGAGRGARRLWTPALLASLTCWLKADAITGLNDGDAVATWTDVSAGSHSVTQGTPLNRPVYKVNIVNGKPVVRFNGATPTWLATGAFTFNQPATVFAVAILSASGTYCYSDSLAQYYRSMYSSSQTTLNISGATNLAATVTNLTTWSILLGIYNGASGLASYNGTTTSGDVGSNAASGITIGAFGNDTSGMTGDMAEWGACTTALSTADRQKVEGYLAWKYALAANLPANHPYKGAPPWA